MPVPGENRPIRADFLSVAEQIVVKRTMMEEPWAITFWTVTSKVGFHFAYSASRVFTSSSCCFFILVRPYQLCGIL